jgi:hypothetical protein
VLANSAVDWPDGSHSLAAAGHCDRSADDEQAATRADGLAS